MRDTSRETLVLPAGKFHESPTLRVYTSDYLAPEAVLNFGNLEAGFLRPYDMWGLGCVLVEMLTNETAFPSDEENDNDEDDDAEEEQLKRLHRQWVRTCIQAQHALPYYKMTSA